MTLYEITQALIDAYNNLEIDKDGCIVNCDALDQLNIDFDEKAVNVALMIKNKLAEAEAIKNEKMALAKRQKSAENEAEGLKNYLDNMMKAAGKNSLKDAKVALSYRKSTTVAIDLEKISPEWLKEMDPTKEESYRKSDLTKALKEGQEIPGAVLVDKQNLQIK